MRQPLILIPARGGSKGVARKNLRTVGGISLVGRAVRTARAACRACGGGRVVVDSDDDEILAEARCWGAETNRRAAVLGGDRVGTIEVLAAALRALAIAADDARPIVLMQATSPFTPAAHVVAVIAAWDAAGGAPAISVAPSAHPPAWAYTLDASNRLQPIDARHVATRRQDLPVTWRPSGAVFVSSAGDLHAGRAYERAGETVAVAIDATAAVDIDTPADLALADACAAAAATPRIAIAARTIGDGRCFIIAEAGVNHDGDVAEAHRLVDLAADIGADAVKFQTWKTELVCRRGLRKAAYQSANDGTADDQFAMLRRLELPYAAHAELMAHARERGIVFLSTPDEIVSARFLASLPLPALKIGSGELDNLPYLAQLADFGVPLLLSTGMGTLPEVGAALDAIGGRVPVALLHAVSAYPAPVAQANLRAIATMRAAFTVPVGLSDHFRGPEAALAAVGLGLPLWEKHLTRDRSRSGPDHLASLDGDDFARQIALVRAAESALGDGVKRPQSAEADTRLVVRKRLHAARPLPAGTMLTLDHVIALRADAGLPASAWPEVIGRRCARALGELEPLTDEVLTS